MNKLWLLVLLAAPSWGFLRTPFNPVKRFGPEILQTDAVEYQFEQKVDHFRTLDERKFIQRYYMRLDNYVPGGPIFLFLGGEWDVAGGFISNTSFVGQMADRLGGAAIELEHRYYGQSQPIGDLETESLEFLSIDQALADAANFAKEISQINGFTGPWIVCGTSYSGMLAGFARQKYPHIFHAAYSSSGQQLAKIDFYEYHELTGVGLGKIDPLCPGYLSAAMDELVARITSGTPEDAQLIEKSFNLCGTSDLKNPDDAMYLYSFIANVFGTVVQFAFPGLISTECRLLTNGPGTPLENLAEVIKQGVPSSCLPIHYDDAMEFYRNSTQVAPGQNYRQVLYQTCVELGWFFTLSGDTVFGDVIPVEYFINVCADVFGSRFSQAVLEAGVARTNAEYGSLTPVVTSAIFTHGTFDGWTKVAVETNINDDAPVIMIQDVGHAADQFFFESDPPQLIEARQSVEKQIIIWINQFYKKDKK